MGDARLRRCCSYSPRRYGVPLTLTRTFAPCKGNIRAGLALTVWAEVGGAAGDGGRSYGSAAARARHVAFPPYLQKPAHGTVIARQVGHRTAKDAANDPIQPGQFSISQPVSRSGRMYASLPENLVGIDGAEAGNQVS